ncbi:probable sodium-coupled neutral amino acid transporter 6 [Ananas comosus]|uniref:Probable sodium-coupled neutral amino acid transporter 6 n=1 Tax=Ananas comosus TaxID=4615 RepID=A0A199V0D0_ANACO|nr:probable sodium-coupled neutral amino acid transporter 6 [Ananas comosus]OAY70448.1 putative sodium-coupled neutral amino acid transporter 6 [Ananas comosus]
MKSPAKGGAAAAASSTVTDPLLPEYAAESGGGGGASVSGAVFNVSTSIVGAGIMSIPAAMRVLGVGPALALIAAVAFLSDASVEFLMRYTGWSSGAPSYAGLMGEAFGRAGAAVLNLCIAVTTAGTLIVFLIIIGDVLSGSVSGGETHAGVLQEWFGEQWWNGREVALLFIVVFVLLPLVLPKRVDSLRFTSAVSILLAAVFMCISLGIAISALIHGTAKMPRLFPDFANLSSVFELFTAVPVVVVAFTFHFNVHPIRAELEKASDMATAVRVSLLLCSALYSAVGLLGYLLFGDATMPDVLSNFDRSVSGSGSPLDRALNDAVRLSYALHLILVFPLLHFSLRLNVDELLFARLRARRPLRSDNVRFAAVTGCLLGLLYVAAVAIPDVWALFQFFGSTTAVCISLIFPGAIVLRDVHGIAKRRDKVLAATMIALAVITSSIAIASNIISSFGGKASADHAAQ